MADGCGQAHNGFAGVCPRRGRSFVCTRESAVAVRDAATPTRRCRRAAGGELLGETTAMDLLFTLGGVVVVWFLRSHRERIKKSSKMTKVAWRSRSREREEGLGARARAAGGRGRRRGERAGGGDHGGWGCEGARRARARARTQVRARAASSDLVVGGWGPNRSFFCEKLVSSALEEANKESAGDVGLRRECKTARARWAARARLCRRLHCIPLVWLCVLSCCYGWGIGNGGRSGRQPRGAGGKNETRKKWRGCWVFFLVRLVAFTRPRAPQLRRRSPCKVHLQWRRCPRARPGQRSGA